MTKFCKFMRTRPFKLAVIVLLLLLAVRLKGEPLTLGALAARLADLLAEVGFEGAVGGKKGD